MRERMTAPLAHRAALVSIALVLAFLSVWHLATRGPAQVAADSEHARAPGASASQAKAVVPRPRDVAEKIVWHLQRPFYDHGPNDRGLGTELGTSVARLAAGYLLAALVAIPIGFLIGASPLMRCALDPFIRLLKPISPLAWLPLALTGTSDSGVSSIVVIFVGALWPMLINTAFSVAGVRREWLSVARTLEVGTLRRAFTVILPAAAPDILAGMRISIGMAWTAIVAVEMLVGGTGIGTFLWNAWNELAIADVIIAILVIGIVGMVLDQILARLARLVTFAE
jgi:nitrate/nitrite transport system permease protein